MTYFCNRNMTDLFKLSSHVVFVVLSLTTVMQNNAIGSLFFNEETWWFEFLVAEAHVLVQVVQTVQEISHVSTQHSQDSIIAKLTDEIDKLNAQHLHQAVLFLVSDICQDFHDLLEQRLRVLVVGAEGHIVDLCLLAYLVPHGSAVQSLGKLGDGFEQKSIHLSAFSRLEFLISKIRNLAEFYWSRKKIWFSTKTSTK